MNQIFRNVKSYGAVGDGVTDDTAAIRDAMFDGDRCGENCNGATINNAIVYFPPGEYLVSGTIQVIYGTQLIGDVSTSFHLPSCSGAVGPQADPTLPPRNRQTTGPPSRPHRASSASASSPPTNTSKKAASVPTA